MIARSPGAARIRSLARVGTLSLVAAAAAACAPLGPAAGPEPSAPSAPSLPTPPIVADSGLANVVAPGVTYHRLFRGTGPFAIHVLEIDRAACWTPIALKTDTAAIGRARVSLLLERVRTSGDTVAAINGDFFLFNPPGVPTGAHVDDSRVITGPGTRPVIAIDRAGRIHMLPLRARGFAIGRRDTVALTEWNHLPVTTLGAFDSHWGVRTDTSAGTLQVAIGRSGRVLRVFNGRTAASIPRDGWVLAAGRSAPAATRRWLASLRTGDSVQVQVSLEPIQPVDAIGGFPLLVRDSAVAAVLDSASTRALGSVRHPRTAVGVGSGGRRLVYVVVDGRQPGYSVGMTLPELASLMLELGSRDAINLDGGGSSTMAIRTDGGVRILNRPSDAGGERQVANALGVAKGRCQ